MIYVLLRSGECVAIAAAAAGRRNEKIVCTDAYGQAIAIFPANDVEVFTHSEPEALALQAALRNDHAAIPTEP